MDLLEGLFTRRSVRKFLPVRIPILDLKEIVKLGMYAPSAGNQQPWEFIIINERQKLDDITEIHPHAGMLKTASAAILVCGNTDHEKHPGFWVQDCSACTQNILLAIHGRNLAGVWLGIYPRDERVEGFKKMFNLPLNIIPFSLIPIGKADEKTSTDNRYSEKLVHINKY